MITERQIDEAERAIEACNPNDIRLWAKRALEAAERCAWQTMETAPKDGTPIELCRPPAGGKSWWKRRVVAIWHDFGDGDAAWIWPDNNTSFDLEDPDNSIDKRWIANGAYNEATDGFTHWRHVSPPPTTATNG